MDQDDLNYLLNRVRGDLKLANDNSNPNKIVNCRYAASGIVNYYNVVLLNAGKKLGLNVKEGHDINKKLFTISQELPELLDKSQLIDKVASIRNSISHSDISTPKKSKLEYTINSADEFKGFVENLVETKIKDGKKHKSLKQQYNDKKDFIRRLIKITFPEFKKRDIESPEFQKVFKNLDNFEKINVDRLDHKSLKSLLSLVDDSISDAEEVYDYIHSHCPKCGGKLKIRTEEENHYRSDEDYEPESISVYQVVECSKCGIEIDRELITVEYL